jgi:hypothetical protein
LFTSTVTSRPRSWGVGEVCNDDVGPDVEAVLEVLGVFAEFVLAAGDQDDVEARPSEQSGEFVTDTARGAGDQRSALRGAKIDVGVGDGVDVEVEVGFGVVHVASGDRTAFMRPDPSVTTRRERVNPATNGRASGTGSRPARPCEHV